MNYMTLLKDGAKIISAKAPLILSAIAVTGVGTTAYLASKATLEADAKIKEQQEQDNPTAFKDKVRYTWRLYIPTALSGLSTVCAIILSQKLNAKRQAAVASAYLLSEKALKEYREKVVDLFGDKKATKIEDSIAADHISNSTSPEVVILNARNQLCYDGLTGRYFEANLETLRQAVNSFNRDLLCDGFKTLNQFFDYIGLPYVDTGNDIGWEEMVLVDVHFGTHLSPNGEPVISMEHRTLPRPPQR